MYESYSVTCHFKRDHGLGMYASTKEGEDAEACYLHAGLTTMQVEWTATRLGGPPTIPDPNPRDPNAVLLEEVVSPEGLNVAADGVSAYYVVSGVYTYGFKKKSAVVLAYPVPPFLNWSLLSADRNAAELVSQDVLWPSDPGTSPPPPASPPTSPGSPGISLPPVYP